MKILKRILPVAIILAVLITSLMPAQSVLAADAVWTVKTGTLQYSTAGGGRAISRESDGRLWVTYQRSDGSYKQVYCAYSDDGGENWTEEAVTEALGDQWYGSIATDSEDNLHIVWTGKTWGDYPTVNQIQYRKRTSEGWQAQEAVTNVNYAQDAPAIAIDSDDNINVIWSGMGWGSNTTDLNVQYRKKTDTWQSQEGVTDVGEYQIKPCMAIDGDNYIHIAWYGKGWAPYTAYQSIQYRRRTDTWQAQESVCAIDSRNQLQADIALDTGNYPHLTWFGNGHGSSPSKSAILYRYKTSGGWQDLEVVRALDTDSSESSIVITTEASIYLTWCDRSFIGGTDVIVYAKRGASSWPAPTQVTFDEGCDRLTRTLWANHPTVGGNRSNVPVDGLVALWSGYETAVFKVQFLSSDALEWPATPPTVTTQDATDILSFSATGNGTITALNNGNCDIRGFDWDTDSGAPYEHSVTETGSYGTGAYTKSLTSLPSGTMIYYRAKAHSAAGWGYGSEVSFVTEGATPPTVSSGTAVNVGPLDKYWGATLQGTLTSLGDYSPVYASFEYGLTTAYGTTTTDQTMTSVGGFSVDISNLNPYLTYHFRARIRYNGAYVYGSDVPFYIGSTTVPSITTNDASGVSQTGAVLHGTLTGLGGYSPVYVSFEYGLTTAYGSNTVDQSRGATGSFQASISELSVGQTYHFRARVRYDGSYVYGTDNTFNTPGPNTPIIATGTATNIGDTSATLQGNLTSLGDYTPVYVYFQYGATTSYGVTTSEQSKTATCTFGQSISGLQPSTTYHFRAVVKYDSNYIYGVDSSFVTSEEDVPGEPGIDPPDILRIDDIKVFSNYFESSDQLYVLSYRIIYESGTPILDVSDYFDFQLLDGTTLKAQIPVRSWDYKPGSIYLGVNSALTWEGSYTIKIIGNPNKWETPPECYRNITSGDWQGSDLTQLDTWVISLAQSLQTYYNSEIIIYTTGGQAVLSSQGGVIFNMGIPGLSSQRPHLFSAMTEFPQPGWEEHEREYEGTLVPSEQLGPYLTGMLEDGAGFFGIEMETFGGMLFGITYLALAGLIGMVTRPLVGLGLASPVIILGAWFGLIPLGFIMIVTGVVALYIVFLVWVKGV